ncbi:MAG: site-specific DNA-methyltransferase [Clostridiales bacterium]|nr:site-specific DNA-methyltransferase [Clostridiales bacterium]
MPTLEWIGKEKVINHHQEVPFRVLERQYSYDADGMHAEDNGSENMVIHGDNLEALKALLPRHEGRIKCIYIDPPYNTGNEGWVYNDNVNDPHIVKWLGEVVGKEGEDLSRHDKWLCMMYPRLKLLQRLLSDDGVIFISIDDNELYSLKMICDEIFGSSCFVSNISWQRTYSKRNDSKGIPAEVEHIVVYSKTSNWNPKRLRRTEEMNEGYSSLDGDAREWSSVTINAPGASTHQGMVYAIQHPITLELMYPPLGRCWSFGQPQMLECMNEWSEYELRTIDDYDKRCEICGSEKGVSQDTKAIMLKNVETQEKAIRRYEEGIKKITPWPMLYFTAKGRGGLRRKQYLDKSAGKVATNYWAHSEVGHTGEAANELAAIFGGHSPFDTPKPTRLIERILQIAGNQETLILDSFAGSGTTAHAVLNMNKADGGHRKFILIEMMDYADSITAERVKRAIQGYGTGKKAVEGTGGDFSYYELGEPLLLGENLNEAVGLDKIREYIWYTETKQPIHNAQFIMHNSQCTIHNDGDEDGKLCIMNPELCITPNPYYLGDYNHTAYYFHYEPDRICVLDYAFMATISEKADGYVIYADRCALSNEELLRFGITFKKIPRDITRL